MQIEVKPGVLYFLKGEEDGRVHEIVARLRSAGYRLLVVSSREPGKVGDDLEIPAHCTLTLTESVGQYSVDPQNLMILTDTITKFIEHGDQPALLIEDLELLKQKNEFLKVLRFVGFVYDSLVKNRGIGFIMIDPQSWDVREMAYLGKEGSMVEEKDRLNLRSLDPHTSRIPPSQNV